MFHLIIGYNRVHDNIHQVVYMFQQQIAENSSLLKYLSIQEKVKVNI